MTEGSVDVLDHRRDFGDRYAEVQAWVVPDSDRYPDGIKYSMQYGTAAGETILRYDNFPDHPDAARHHKHTAGGDVRYVEFEGIRALFQRFKDEVRSYDHKW